MNFSKEKIGDLLSTEAPENQFLALELIQSQWKWTWEEALIFAVDFYCSNNSESFSLSIGNIIISYHLELIQDYCANAIRDIIELVFKIERAGQVLFSEELDYCNYSASQFSNLSDYGSILKNHFESKLPLLFKYGCAE